MSSDLRFVRIKGRVIPIKGKGSAPQGSGISKRYGVQKEKADKPKQIGVAQGSLLGAISGAASGIFFKPHTVTTAASRALKPALIGAAIGAVVGSIKLYKKDKGESRDQFLNRISGKKNKTGL